MQKSDVLSSPCVIGVLYTCGVKKKVSTSKWSIFFFFWFSALLLHLCTYQTTKKNVSAKLSNAMTEWRNFNMELRVIFLGELSIFPNYNYSIYVCLQQYFVVHFNLYFVRQLFLKMQSLQKKHFEVFFLLLQQIIFFHEKKYKKAIQTCMFIKYIKSAMNSKRNLLFIWRNVGYR